MIGASATLENELDNHLTQAYKLRAAQIREIMMSKTTKLGLITTGHGPRNEYVAYHRNVMKYLGVDVEIKITNALDGLSRDEIREIEARPGDRYIGCHIHEPGATGDRMGPGWTHIWAASRHLAPLYQKCLDSLEAEGVDATILCCAEEYPLDAFQSKRPFVLPWLVITEWVRVSMMYTAEPKIGILIVDEEHLEQDTATWQSEPWMKRLKVFIEIKKRRLDEALARFREQNVDMVIHWGYGFSTAPGDPPHMIKSIEEAAGAPFIIPLRLATSHTRDLFRPSFDDRRFVGEQVANPPGQAPEGAL